MKKSPATALSGHKHIASGNTAGALKIDGNPEGKGCNTFMLDWHRSEPQGVIAKPRRQLLVELFTSMLVLSSAFRFRPVVGAPHYLYYINGEWSLSLISPDEWSHERRKAFAGRCLLQRDMTWTIAPSTLLGEKNPVSAAMTRFYDAFAMTMDTDRTIEQVLPFYIDTMPYYQRLYASALSRSVLASMTIAEHTENSCQIWLALLPHQSNALLDYRS